MHDGGAGEITPANPIASFELMTAFIVPKEHLPALKAAGFESGLDIQSYNQANVTVLVEPLDEYYCAIENVSVGQFGYCGGI